MMQNATKALREPCHYQFVPGRGYVFHGSPPTSSAPRLAVLNSCEPPTGAVDWSWHYLNAPSGYGGTPVKLQWRPATKNWHPVLGRGNRVAFSSSYLASHGWTYRGPA